MPNRKSRHSLLLERPHAIQDRGKTTALGIMASHVEKERSEKAEKVLELLRDAIAAGSEARDVLNEFHGKFLEASRKAGMLRDIRAPSDLRC